MPKFAANLTTLFAEVPFSNRFAAAACAGFVAVEFLFPYDHAAADVARWLREAEVDAVMHNLPPGDWGAGERGLAALSGREADFAHSLDMAIDYARACGVRRLHAMAGLSAAGANRATYVTNLRYAAERLAGEGIDLLIEPISVAGIADYYLASQDLARAIVEEVAAPNLRIQLDIYHRASAGGDVLATLRRDIDLIGHIQVAGVPGRHEPDSGSLDYAPLFALIDALGYDGWIGCEYHPADLTEDGLDWLF